MKYSMEGDVTSSNDLVKKGGAAIVTQ
jgi:hypothetical protein